MRQYAAAAAPRLAPLAGPIGLPARRLRAQRRLLSSAARLHGAAASIRRAVRYHLGSIAAGSFIVAVVQFVRLVLEYVNRKTKQAQEHNAALKFAMCCLRCCAWYTEQIVTFVNRNAYIIIAVKGTGYCPSAARAVSLIVTNALRLAAVNTFGDILLWLGMGRQGGSA